MMKSKFLMFAAVACGISFLTACASDNEQETSMFYKPDADPAEGIVIDDGGTGGVKAGEAVITTLNNGPVIDESTPGGFGDDITAEDSEYTNGYRKIILPQPYDPVYFAFDTFSVPFDQIAKVNAVAEYMKKYTNSCVIIEGNCDDRGTQEYNRGLGERRALAVKTALLERGIAADRIMTVSYGEDRPAVNGTGDLVWSRNRRAELVLVLPSAK